MSQQYRGLQIITKRSICFPLLSFDSSRSIQIHSPILLQLDSWWYPPSFVPHSVRARSIDSSTFWCSRQHICRRLALKSQRRDVSLTRWFFASPRLFEPLPSYIHSIACTASSCLPWHESSSPSSLSLPHLLNIRPGNGQLNKSSTILLCCSF